MGNRCKIMGGSKVETSQLSCKNKHVWNGPSITQHGIGSEHIASARTRAVTSIDSTNVCQTTEKAAKGSDSQLVVPALTVVLEPVRSRQVIHL